MKDCAQCGKRLTKLKDGDGLIGYFCPKCSRLVTARKDIEVVNIEYRRVDLLLALHEAKEKVGDKHLSVQRYNKAREQSHPTANTIRERFGSWDDALTEADIPVAEDKLNHTKQDCIDELQHAAIKGCISKTIYNSYRDKNTNTPAYNTIINKFGSWENACDKADVQPGGL